MLITGKPRQSSSMRRGRAPLSLIDRAREVVPDRLVRRFWKNEANLVRLDTMLGQLTMNLLQLMENKDTMIREHVDLNNLPVYDSKVRYPNHRHPDMSHRNAS
jgi:hypothetical protein